MKKILLLLIISILFFTCKKESISPSDVKGTWSLYSFNKPSYEINVTADQIHCMADNHMTFNSNSTIISSFDGTGSCVIGTFGGSPFPVVFGSIQDQPVTEKWHLNGNKITIGTIVWVISNVNDQLILTYNDTTNAVITPFIVYHKL